MRRVHRKHCICPTAWFAQVRKAFPDYTQFLQHAVAFEKLGVNSSTRRAGFSTFAPGALVKAKFPAIWGKHKEIIAGMSHRKCVYCEGAINARRGSHVEHFKPKALFPLAAYEWTNYFLGCPGCNGAKSDKWPQRGGYVRPDKGDPARHFKFADNGTVKAVKAGSPAERMLEDFDLYRIWLSDERKQNIHVMLNILRDATKFYNDGHHEAGRRLARTLLDTIDAPQVAYSVALTQCFWRAWERACPGVNV